MKASAKHLTPVILGLGDKSPCIVDDNINVVYAAKRIACDPFINTGQTCIASTILDKVSWHDPNYGEGNLWYYFARSGIWKFRRVYSLGKSTF